MMDDMKVSSSFDCPTECNTIKYSVKEKIVPIDPNQFCPKPKSLWVNTYLNNRPNLPEIVNFFYSKVFNKYNTSERLIYKPFYDTIIEDICVKMVRDEIAMVSIYFPHGTYTKIQQALKFTFTDKIASFGKIKHHNFIFSLFTRIPVSLQCVRLDTSDSTYCACISLCLSNHISYLTYVANLVVIHIYNL